MRILKSIALSLAGGAAVLTGTLLYITPAEAYYCKPSMIPAHMYPTGISCPVACESEL